MGRQLGLYDPTELARERARLLGALQWRAWFLDEAWRKDVFERFLDRHCLDDTDYNDPVEP